MDRITDKQLQAIVDRINRMLGMPAAPYVKVGDKHVAQIGNFHLDHAYGGVSLARMVNDGGGISNVLGVGHVTKRDLADRMYAFIRGLEMGKEHSTARQALQRIADGEVMTGKFTHAETVLAYQELARSALKA